MIKLYISISRKNVSSFKFKLTKIDETRNYLTGERNHNDLITEKIKIGM